MNQSYQDKWELRSSLRLRPRKPIDFKLNGDFFPVDKQVLFLLPEIQSLNPAKKKEILLLSFYNYLKDIIGLELEWVYSACNNIFKNQLEVNFTAEMMLNALTIIMDEYYHVYIAYDYMIQLKQQFPNIIDIHEDFSDSYYAMITIKNRIDPSYKDIFEIIAVCIFETTLIKDLVTYFDSPTIHPIIKYYINDHMNDESRHYVYFFDLLKFIWSNMSENGKNEIGSQLGDFVSLYLNVEGEKKFNKKILEWVIDDHQLASDMIERLYHGFEINNQIPIVKNVINVLSKTNILTHTAVIENFKKNNLL